MTDQVVAGLAPVLALIRQHDWSAHGPADAVLRFDQEHGGFHPAGSRRSLMHHATRAGVAHAVFACSRPWRSACLAHIPGSGVYPAALADFIADTSNRCTGVWQAAPALVQLEADALDWLRDRMRFPDVTRDRFTTR